MERMRGLRNIKNKSARCLLRVSALWSVRGRVASFAEAVQRGLGAWPATSKSSRGYPAVLLAYDVSIQYRLVITVSLFK